MKDWHKFIWEQNGQLTIRELSKELPHIPKSTIKEYLVRKKVPYKKLIGINQEWKNFVKEHGHKYTMDELAKKFPDAKKNTIKAYCCVHKIKYIQTHPYKSHTKIKPIDNSNYFNVKEHETWLI